MSPVEFLEKIVKINSVNPPGNELPVAKEIKALLDSHGIEAELLPFDENRANLVAHLRGNEGKESSNVLGLSGHMDVVPVGEAKWKHDAFSAAQEDGKMYGRGTCDMKGGLVALLFAMIELKEEGVPLNGDIKMLVTAGEEVGAVGAKRLQQEGYMDDVDALVIAEPTSNEVCISEKGVLWLEVTTYGKTAHGSAPHLGINAIDHMHHLLHALYTKFEMNVSPHDQLGEPTYNVSMINGGVGTNVVPDQASFRIDIRTIPGQSHDEIAQSIESLFNEVKAEIPDLSFDIKRLNDLRAVETSASDEFAKIFKDQASRYFGEEKEFKGMVPYTDGAALITEEADIPLVIYGSADLSLAHQPNEHIEIEPFLESIKLYKEVIKEYLA